MPDITVLKKDVNKELENKRQRLLRGENFGTSEHDKLREETNLYRQISDLCKIVKELEDKNREIWSKIDFMEGEIKSLQDAVKDLASWVTISQNK